MNIDLKSETVKVLTPIVSSHQPSSLRISHEDIPEKDIQIDSMVDL